MSVRRLADENVQPESFAFSDENKSWARGRIALYPEGRQQSAVIPLLMRAQEQEGWISRAAIEHVAEMLDMPYIRVLEVATFYTQFQLQPVGTRAHIQVCGTTPCMLRGAEDIRAVCQKKIHEVAHRLNADGTLSWEEVECLGACVNAPMVAIGMDTYEDLTPERMEEIIDAFAAGEGDTIKPGPQIARTYAAPETGLTSLTDVPERQSAGKTGKAANDQAPTKAGRMRAISAESTPGIEGPGEDAKVSVSAAESARKTANRAAEADGEPNDAAREGATGAESKAGKIDGGRAVDDDGIQGSAELFARPEGTSDNLKLISGVGPVLEKKLNQLGVTQFAQVAAFNPDDVTRLDDALRFRGRIDRDDWIKQAKALAVGEDEYVRVFGKKPR